MASLTAQTHSHLGVGTRKKTERTKGMGGLGKTEFGKDAAICLWEEVIFVKFQSKCAGTMWPLTSTLTLSTSWMQARLSTMVCKFGWDPAICLVEEAICAKCLQTDKQTDGRWTPHDCISSWTYITYTIGLYCDHDSLTKLSYWARPIFYCAVCLLQLKNCTKVKVTYLANDILEVLREHRLPQNAGSSRIRRVMRIVTKM